MFIKFTFNNMYMCIEMSSVFFLVEFSVCCTCKWLQLLLVLFQVKNVKLDCKISAKVSTV